MTLYGQHDLAIRFADFPSRVLQTCKHWTTNVQELQLQQLLVRPNPVLLGKRSKAPELCCKNCYKITHCFTSKRWPLEKSLCESKLHLRLWDRSLADTLSRGRLGYAFPGWRKKCHLWVTCLFSRIPTSCTETESGSNNLILCLVFLVWRGKIAASSRSHFGYR